MRLCSLCGGDKVATVNVPIAQNSEAHASWAISQDGAGAFIQCKTCVHSVLIKAPPLKVSNVDFARSQLRSRQVKNEGRALCRLSQIDVPRDFVDK